MKLGKNINESIMKVSILCCPKRLTALTHSHHFGLWGGLVIKKYGPFKKRHITLNLP